MISASQFNLIPTSPNCNQSMQFPKIQPSKFSLAAGNPICTYLQKAATFKENITLSRVWMLSGDPTTYGQKDIKMSEEGYEEVRKSIRNKNNHGYIASVGTLEARSSIIKHFGGGKDLSPSDVIITSGVNQGLLHCLESICQEGDNILVPDTGFPFFEQPAAGMNVEVRHYKLHRDNNFQIDLEHVRSLVDDRTKFVFVINPSNPMGSVFSKTHLLDLIKLAEELKVLLVADEVYFGMSFEKDGFTSLGHLTSEAPVITLSGMEKIFCVPGWATSWMILYDPLGHMRHIKGCLEVKCSLMIHTNTFIQKALPNILDSLEGPHFVDKFMPIFKSNHDRLVSQLEGSKWLRALPAQGTFYLSVEVNLDVLKGFQSDVQLAQSLIEEENVNLLPLSVMGNLVGFRFLTFCKQELYKELFERLGRFYEQHKS